MHTSFVSKSSENSLPTSTETAPTPSAPSPKLCLPGESVSSQTNSPYPHPSNAHLQRPDPLDSAQPLDPTLFPNPAHRDNGVLPCTIANIAHLLKSYAITIRYNLIKKSIDISWPGQTSTTENRDTIAITTIQSLTALNRISAGQIPSILETLADRNPSNPVANWISSKPWDGTDRLTYFANTLTVQNGYDKKLRDILIRRWLISAVAAVLQPQGFYCRGILTLQGPQSIGKTSWFRALVPDVLLREQVLKLDHHLDAGNKDTLITAISHWIVEIGELDSSLKKDVARLKGFITGHQDKIRKPYGRTDAHYPRRTVFCASVNDHEFLVDPTGNTRFWTIPVTKIDYQHTIDMQQVFAQVVVLFRQGESWWLNQEEEELLEAHNKEHCAVSAIRERLLAAMDLEHSGKWPPQAYSASEALRHIGIEHPRNAQCKEAGAIFRERFGDPKKIQGIYRWRIPFHADAPANIRHHPRQDDDDLY